MSEDGSQRRRTALMTVTRANGPPSLAEAAVQLGVAVTDLDESFGVVEIDREDGTYCVEVEVDRLPLGLEKRRPFEGPYSNPRIEHFGPGRLPSEPDSRNR